MKRFLIVFALLGVSCTNKHQLPPQDSYSITVTYKKCGTEVFCELVSEDEEKRTVRQVRVSN